MMYNVTPHGTTGKSPSELLFNRRIRDKIPCVEDIATEVLDDEAYDRDLVRKEMGKRKEDGHKGATVDQVKPGDRVVVKNTIFPHKLKPNFGNTEYDVLRRNEN